MAARKSKKKDTKSHKQPAAPVNESLKDDDVTEEESIHEDVEIEDAHDDIPDIVDQESDGDEDDDADINAEKATKKSNTKSKSKASKDPLPFMDTFYQLSSEESHLRSIAARDLISHCFFSSEGVNTTDAAYALTRLMNGLCTGRAASRQGFASALSSFVRLAHSPSVTLSSIFKDDSFGKGLMGENDAASIFRLKLLAATQFQQTEKEAKKNSGKMKGMEERDHAFGRLFGVLAVVRSGVLGLKDFPSSVTEGYANDLIELYNYKKWLREPAVNAIIELLSTLDAGVVLNITNNVVKPRFFLAADGTLDANGREQWIRGLNSEQIAVALHLQSLQNKVGKYAFPLDRAILTAETVPFFTQALTSTSSVVYPRCHIVWKMLWLYLTEEGEGHRQLRKTKGSHSEQSLVIEQLIEHVVVNGLLGKGETSGSPSNERRSLALQIVSILAGASSLSIVLPPNLIGVVLCADVVERVFLNVLCASGGIGTKRSKRADGGNDGKFVEHHLKPLTSSILSDMVVRSIDENFLERRMAFVKAFVSVDPRFDIRTKTQTVSRLLMMEPGAKEFTDEQEQRQKALWDEYLSFLEEAIITSDTLHKATMYVELMFKLAKRDLPKAPANEARRVMRFFMTAAFFDCSDVSPSTNNRTPSSKKKKNKKTPNKVEDNSPVPPELASAIRIKEMLHSNRLAAIPHPSRAIISSRFYSLVSDFISTVNGQSRGGNKSKSFYGNVSKPEAVYRALSEISGIASVLDLSGAKHYASEISGNATDDESLTELSRKHMLEVKRFADEALIKECDGSDGAEALRAKSLFATGCASLMISLYLQLSSGETDNMEDDKEDAEDDREAIHEFISDLSEIVSDFSRVLENKVLEEDDDDENPLAAMAGLLVNILSSSVGGEGSVSSASKLTRETVKLAWSGVLSLMSTISMKNFVDEDVMRTLIESVCASSSVKDEKDDDESIEDVDEEDQNDGSQVFAQATNMELDLEEQGESAERSDNESEGSEDEDVELDPSTLENMLLEDSDAEIDVLEHHEGADKALAQLIKMKQDTRKASQSERERIELCNRLRCTGLLDALFSVSVFKSGWLPLEAVLGSFVPILRSYKSIVKSIEKSSSSSLASKSINEKKSLLDRMASLIQEKLSKFRCSDSSDDNRGSILKAVADISEEMKHSLNLAHCSSCSVALITVVRCLHDAENNEEVTTIYSAALQDWMSRKSTKIHTCVFDDVIQRLPSLAVVVLVEPVTTSARNAHSGYLKCESLRLLSLLYRVDKSNNEGALSKKAQNVLNDSCNKVAVVLKDSLCDSTLEKTKNKDEILNAVKHFVTFAKSHASFISAAHLKMLIEALKMTAEATKSAGVKHTCSKLADEIAEIATHAGQDNEPKPTKSSAKKKKKSKK